MDPHAARSACLSALHAVALKMITIIFGLPGVGKTKLLAHLASERMTLHAFDDLLACKREVSGRQYAGGMNLPEKHLVFSDLPLRSEPSVMPVRKAYHSPIERIGLCNSDPNDKWPQTWHFPPYAQFFISEAQRGYNSRARGDRGLPDHVSRWYETHRHNGHNVTLDCQRCGLIDLNIRGIAGELICVLKSDNQYDRSGRLVGSTWDTLVFYDHASAEEYEKSGEAAGGEKRQYKHTGNVFACYDSYCYKGLHMEGRENCKFDLITR